jgi:hypothetical protein
MERSKVCQTTFVGLLLFLMACVGFVTSANAEIYEEIYFDDFTTDTLANYAYGGNTPLRRVSYDGDKEALRIILGDDVNFSIQKEVPIKTKSGYFEIKFMPTRIYPFDGISLISVLDDSNNYYQWHFSRDSNKSFVGNWQQYRARAVKNVNNNYNILDIFIPTPDSYSLNEWHTLAMKFSPESITTYIDDFEVATFVDSQQFAINVSKINVSFMQQDQYLGHIKLLGVKDVIDAEIDIDPNTLNLDSQGKVITCYIELPNNDVSLVDLATVRLSGGPLAELSPSDVGDVDEDGQQDIMVKFDRQDVIDFILQGEVEDQQEIELTVEGNIVEGTRFVGSDVIRVLKKDRSQRK